MTDIQKKYYKRAKTISRFLICLPNVQAILLNGSLAQGKAKETSDIDLLIITKSGRLWTARFLVLMCLTIFGLKRSKDHNKSHAGKICANYFLSENFLKIPTGRGRQMDNYCADNYNHSILLAGDEKIFNNFFDVNKDLFINAIPNSRASLLLSDSPPAERFSPCPRGSKRGWEWGARGGGSERLGEVEDRDPEIKLSLLDPCFLVNNVSGCLAVWLEHFLKNLQIKKIERDPVTKRYSALIFYNDSEARFHPPKRVW